MLETIQGIGVNSDVIKRIPEKDLENVIKELKGDILTLVHDSGSGHCGGSLSVLRPLLVYFKEVYTPERELHLSKGHCVPALYAIGHTFGNISNEEMEKFRCITGLSGHAEKRVQEIPSGILGQGAGVANGMALAEKLRGTNRKVYSFHGDGELDEGAMLEAIEAAATQKLNVCYVIDHNKKNLTGNLIHDFYNKIAAIEKLGITVLKSENTIEELAKSYKTAESLNGSVAIIINSIKGEGISFMEDHASGWHGNPLTDKQYEDAMQELGLKPKTFRKGPRIIVARDQRVEEAIESLKTQGYGIREEATRRADLILKELGHEDDKILVFAPDIKSSVKADDFAEKFPNRFYDFGIKEMTSVLVAMGTSVKGYKPHMLTFDAFSSIFFSAIIMADYGNVPYLGLMLPNSEFIGEDGSSHTATGNLGAYRALHNIKTIANPADIGQARQAIEYCVQEKGLFYIRLGRPSVPNIYGAHRKLIEPGKADILVKGNGPVIITTGQEVFESLIAAEMLKKDGVNASVVNVAYFKPFDTETICRAAKGKHVIVTEAHNPEVGLASIVAYELMLKGINIKSFTPIGFTGDVPSASIEAQKQLFGLRGEDIYACIRRTINQ